MDRYDIYINTEQGIEEDSSVIAIEKYQYGDWVKYEDASSEIFKLEQKIENLELALQKVYDIVYKVI